MSKSAVTYKRLNEKYLRDAEELLKKGDYSQASEKLWGAAAEMVKAAAKKRENKELGGHRLVFDYVLGLDKEFPDLNLKRLFMTARLLRTNFYEDELPREYVRAIGYTDVKEFVSKMRKLLE